MSLNAMRLELVRENTKRELDAIRSIESQPFTADARSVLGNDTLILYVAPGVDPSSPTRHLIRLGGGGNVARIAQQLPCGILSRDGAVVAARRTDISGCFWIELAQGEYSLRFVNEIRTRVDVDILVRLNDSAAREQLAVAAEFPCLAEPLRRYARGLTMIDQLDDRVVEVAGQQSTKHETIDLSTVKRDQLSASIELLSRYVEWTKLEPEKRSHISMPQVSEMSLKPFGGLFMLMNFLPALAAAPKNEAMYSAKITGGEDDSEWFGQDRSDIYINCPCDKIASGLCRLDIVEQNGTVTTKLPKLKRISGRWLFRESITELLNGRNPGLVDVFLIPATRNTYAVAFDDDKVRALLHTVEDPQRSAMEEFLKSLEDRHE